MKIPKVISKNGHEYILVKQCNEGLYLYKDLLYGYMETFTKFDLGLITERENMISVAKKRRKHKNIINEFFSHPPILFVCKHHFVQKHICTQKGLPRST